MAVLVPLSGSNLLDLLGEVVEGAVALVEQSLGDGVVLGFGLLAAALLQDFQVEDVEDGKLADRLESSFFDGLHSGLTFNLNNPCLTYHIALSVVIIVYCVLRL